MPDREIDAEAEFERLFEKYAGKKGLASKHDLEHLKSEFSAAPAKEPAPAKERPLRGLSPMQKKFKCDDGNCGAVHDNPHYKDSNFYCADCHEPLGTERDVYRLDKCPTCGAVEVVKNPRSRD